ncbi:MAG TPA: hypothetical protein VE173_09660 [Longimicrobiales bacterium]|nr:hypothetical protein [Longimicrobiales bacterium]
MSGGKTGHRGDAPGTPDEESRRSGPGKRDVAREEAATQEAATQEAAQKLGPLVALEAHRMVSEAAIRPDPQRLAEGWERRFIADGQRAEEAVDLYRRLGYEVVADPVRPEDLAGECEACRIVAMMRFKSIYTRRRPEGGGVGERDDPR